MSETGPTVYDGPAEKAGVAANSAAAAHNPTTDFAIRRQLARIVPLLSVEVILRPSLLRVKRVQSRRAATSSGHKRWVRTARSGSRTDRLISPGSRARLRGDRAWRDLLAQHHGLVPARTRPLTSRRSR